MGRRVWLGAVILALVLAVPAGSALAKKGGGGKPGGGGDDPVNTTPPDILLMVDAEAHLIQDDGSGLAYLTDLYPYAGTATWSPDGSEVAFWGDLDGLGIYVMDADGGLPELVVSIEDPGPSLFLHLSWSPVSAPDGEYKLAFTDVPLDAELTTEELAAGSPSSLYTEIFVVNLDGTDRERVSFSGGVAQDPTWSRDAGQIAYARRTGSIRVLDLDRQQAGSPPPEDRVFYQSDLKARSIEWARTSDQIVFQADYEDVDDYADLFVIDVSYDSTAGAWAGTLPLNITNTPNDEEHHPTWSPDDSDIACYSRYWSPKGKRGATPSLQLVSVASGTRQTLHDLKDAGFDGFCLPVWKRSDP